MPLNHKDRVKQAVSAGGTGALTLGAAASGYQAFAAGDDGKTFPIVIEDGTAWEVSKGTYTHAGTSLARSLVASSTGSLLDVTTSAYVFVDWSAFLGTGAERAMQAITPGGRLTLESGVPVSTSDQTAKTTVYYTPCEHNVIALWDGNYWQPTEFSEVSLALGTVTSALPYDVFAYLSSGALAIEKLAWTDGTNRATAVTIQDGRYCKSGDKTRLYLGTFYTTSTTQTEDSVVNRYLWNHYNRRARSGARQDNTAHNIANVAFVEWNSATASRVNFVIGVVDQSIRAGTTITMERPSSSADNPYAGGACGLNGNSNRTQNTVWRPGNVSVYTNGPFVSQGALVPALGHNYAATYEYEGANQQLQMQLCSTAVEIWG